MVRVFPLAPFERIARKAGEKAGAKRVSSDAVEAIRDAVLDAAEDIATDAVAASRHAGRVTVKAEDIRIVCSRR